MFEYFSLTTENKMSNLATAKQGCFLNQIKAKRLEELSMRYAQIPIAGLMKLGG
jgi:hypothetical protein